MKTEEVPTNRIKIALLNARRLIFSSKKATIGFIIITGYALVAIFAPLIVPYDPYAPEFDTWQSPSFEHLFGTTNLGEDIFSQIIWGTRSSFLIAITCGALASLLAVLVGVVGGYKGGLIDKVAMGITNIFLVLPTLPLMIVLAAYVRVRGTFTIILLITITGWAWDSRVFRSQTLSLKVREFVKAAKMTGDSDLGILFREILPSLIPLIISGAVGTALYAVVAEASLEFLGLGNPAAVTWGTILYWSVNATAHFKEAWWWFLPPGLAIALLGGGFALLNFALDEFSNPRLR